MATLLNLGVPGTVPGVLHPKQSNKFIIQFQNIGGAADSQNLTRQCISATKPVVTFNQVELHRYNSKAYVAGKYEWNPLDLVIEDDVGNGAAIVIQQQLERQLTLTSLGAAPLGLDAGPTGGSYKFNTILMQTDGSGSDGGEPNVIEKWTCQGCWLVSATYGELAYENDAAVQIALNIRFDHAFVEYNNTISSQSALTGE